MTDDLTPPVTSTSVGLIGVSDKDASGYDHKAEALREALTNIIRTIDLSSDENLSPATYRATLASAILARFNVTERDEWEWEIGCMSVAHRSYENPRGIVALDSMIRPEEPGEECPSPFLVRRHPASEWEVFDV